MARRLADSEKYKEINGVKHKRCSTCGEYKPMTEFSSRNVSPDGLAYSCKTCERATAAKSYTKKKNKRKAKQRYEDNKEVAIERSKKRYQENKETIKVQQANWRQSKSGRKLVNAASARRRTKMIEQTPGGKDYCREDVIRRDSVEGVCICQICGNPILNLEMDLQIDHIIGIAAGGSDTFDNVRAAHKTCNLQRPKDCKDLEA